MAGRAPCELIPAIDAAGRALDRSGSSITRSRYAEVAAYWTLAERIRRPVLVAEGSESVAVGALAAEITALATRLLPQAEVVRVDGTNHMMPLQNPEALARIVRGFVSRHS